jgi:TrpR family transcriptional regulator, trp operon repressor
VTPLSSGPACDRLSGNCNQCKIRQADKSGNFLQHLNSAIPARISRPDISSRLPGISSTEPKKLLYFYEKKSIMFLCVETSEALMSEVTEIIKVFTSIDDIRTMKELFEEIFTGSEIQDVALRWRLMTMLHQGIPQRQIASDLGISLCKITRGAKIIKNKRSATRKLLDTRFGECHAKLREKAPGT